MAESGDVLVGERIVLRAGRPEDLARLIEIRREPEVLRRWGEFDSEEISREFIGTTGGFVVECGGEVIGAIQFYEESEPMYRHAGMDLFLTTARHGLGLGTEAVRILARHLLFERDHHRLTIDPATDNGAAIRTYEKVGFRRVGVMRQYERGPDGAWHDGLLMDLLREDFKDAPG